uniref:Putative transcription activator mbf2 n=1 Tax=Nyssomyia neivai TaxID=330878 RepID=A0A1L8DFS8_9DIPT
MNRIIFLFLVCAVGVGFCDEADVISAKTRLIDNLADFERTNSQIQLKATKAGEIQYTLGRRVAGDRLVGITRNSSSWTSPQNVQLSLNYPANGGTGAVVTYVSIVVSQTSNQGRGYIRAGGIGQRFISIIIDAYNTYNFSYSAEIYGV